MKKRKINIMVLMGGPSMEHEVSLHTGEQIIAHLDVNRYTATAMLITKKGEWILPSAGNKSGISKNNKKMPQARALQTLKEKADVVFIALHGTFGEDGTIQSLLDGYDIAYTGSGMLASALSMDKTISARIFRDAGMNVPSFRVFSADQIQHTNKKQATKIIREFGMPLVIKPHNQGSSIGVSIVQHAQHITEAMRLAKQYSPHVIVQKFIRGREITCGVFDRMEEGKSHAVALPPVEIVPRMETFYDYASKYANAGSDHLIPPSNMSAMMVKAIQSAARGAHEIIGCSGMSRSDFILGNDGKLYILEINTIPGMTSTSLLPQSAKAAGIEFPQLLDHIIVCARTKKFRT